MNPRPPRSTRPDTLFPYTTPIRSRAPGPSRENPHDMHAAFLATAPRWRDALTTEYAGLVETLERLIPCMEVPLHLPWIDAINTLKRQRGAVIMAHSYQPPEIFHGVADITGDSRALAKAADDCNSESRGMVDGNRQ